MKEESAKEEVDKLENSKLYKMLPLLEEAILEYQDLFDVKFDAIKARTVRLSSVHPEQIEGLYIETTKKLK